MLLLDAPDSRAAADELGRVSDDVSDACEAIVGLPCPVRWAPLPDLSQRPPASSRADDSVDGEQSVLDRALDELSTAGFGPLLLVPASFDFCARQKQWLTERVRGQQRRHPERQIHYDDCDVTHPLLVQALTDVACRALSELPEAAPESVGLLLVASGTGDATTRADSYALMRLLWERLGLRRGEVAFVRHARESLPEQLSAGARTGLTWLVVSQALWPSESFQHARTILSDAERSLGLRAALTPAIGLHDNVCGWLSRRCLELYRSKRQRLDSRSRSARYDAREPVLVHGPRERAALDAGGRVISERLRYGSGVIAEVDSPEGLRRLLAGFGVRRQRSIVKPTWHGYATGTFSDAPALDALLAALGPGAVLVEGHTTSRNGGGARFDWESDAREQRAWIAQQEQEYLARTGLLGTMSRHGASYVNVTEASWNGECARPEEVAAVLAERGVELYFEPLLSLVPRVLFERRGAQMLSFARFKGPTRLSISNLFGLLPGPFRADWHGPNIAHFARVCCDLARLYGSLFELYGVVESLSCAVRWDRDGLYRSRWGNYDLLPRPGVVCLSRGLAAADALAARLQGQDVERSAFFDVVGSDLGLEPEVATAPLPAELVQRFV